MILVDDVFTFGRLTEAAKQLILEAGATDVLVACLARTPTVRGGGILR